MARFCIASVCWSLVGDAGVVFVSDINRYIPSKSSGFTRLHDRMWCYEKLIGIEAELRERDGVSGGQIRIADFLRNGGKSIIMTNKNLAVYVDHQNGGSVFEIDFKRRRANVCAGYNPSRHALPMVIEPGLSYTMFVDRMVDTATQAEQYRAKARPSSAISSAARTSTRSRRRATASRPSLHRQGSLVQAGRNCPLSMEKMLGLEKDRPALSFVYQITNNSLTPYSFRLAVELTVSLPGIAADKAYLLNKKERLRGLGSRSSGTCTGYRMARGRSLVRGDGGLRAAETGGRVVLSGRAAGRRSGPGRSNHDRAHRAGHARGQRHVVAYRQAAVQAHRSCGKAVG